MNNVLLNRLLKPLLGEALTCVLATYVLSTCMLTMAAAADEAQRGGDDSQTGGGSAQRAVEPPINGCANCGPAISGESRSGGPAVFLPVEPAPPGTLGRTYSLPSRPVPANKHPRVGMIDVCADSAVHVIVRWTNDFRTEETLKGSRDECDPSVWHFESKPLLPGLTQIYRVEVYRGEAGSAPSEVRYVRLIMGRIVYLTV